MGRGVVLIATNDLSQHEARKAVNALHRYGDYSVTVLSENKPDMTDRQSSRWLKCNLYDRSPYGQTLYIDADTRPQADISAGFDMLDDGFDMVIVPSNNQGGDALWHIDKDEREQTYNELGYLPLQLQAGVFFFSKNERTSFFFTAWAREWGRYQDQDQAAFLRALNAEQLRIWLLGRPWNGGAVIQHLFGRCRQ